MFSGGERPQAKDLRTKHGIFKPQRLCWFLTGPVSRFASSVWPVMCEKNDSCAKQGRLGLERRKPEVERREWVRLPLAIPIFVRSQDQNGKDFLEFATAVNISAGGALIAVHRSLRPATHVSLEIPSAPLAASIPAAKSSKNLRARIVRVTHGEGYHLIGLSFTHPLLHSVPRRSSSGRKVVSPV